MIQPSKWGLLALLISMFAGAESYGMGGGSSSSGSYEYQYSGSSGYGTTYTIPANYFTYFGKSSGCKPGTTRTDSGSCSVTDINALTQWGQQNGITVTRSGNKLSFSSGYQTGGGQQAGGGGYQSGTIHLVSKSNFGTNTCPTGTEEYKDDATKCAIKNFKTLKSWGKKNGFGFEIRGGYVYTGYLTLGKDVFEKMGAEPGCKPGTKDFQSQCLVYDIDELAKWGKTKGITIMKSGNQMTFMQRVVFFPIYMFGSQCPEGTTRIGDSCQVTDFDDLKEWGKTNNIQFIKSGNSISMRTTSSRQLSMRMFSHYFRGGCPPGTTASGSGCQVNDVQSLISWGSGIGIDFHKLQGGGVSFSFVQTGQRGGTQNQGQGGYDSTSQNQGQGGYDSTSQNQGQGGYDSTSQNQGQGGYDSTSQNQGQGGYDSTSQNQGQGGYDSTSQNQGQGGYGSASGEGGRIVVQTSKFETTMTGSRFDIIPNRDIRTYFGGKCPAATYRVPGKGCRVPNFPKFKTVLVQMGWTFERTGSQGFNTGIRFERVSGQTSTGGGYGTQTGSQAGEGGTIVVQQSEFTTRLTGTYYDTIPMADIDRYFGRKCPPKSERVPGEGCRVRNFAQFGTVIKQMGWTIEITYSNRRPSGIRFTRVSTQSGSQGSSVGTYGQGSFTITFTYPNEYIPMEFVNKYFGGRCFPGAETRSAKGCKVSSYSTLQKSADSLFGWKSKSQQNSDNTVIKITFYKEGSQSSGSSSSSSGSHQTSGGFGTGMSSGSYKMSGSRSGSMSYSNNYQNAPLPNNWFPKSQCPSGTTPSGNTCKLTDFSQLQSWGQSNGYTFTKKKSGGTTSISFKQSGYTGNGSGGLSNLLGSSRSSRNLWDY